MSRIIELPSHLADMIAAGEVVERPSSVVKELFENAADAGADAVTVEIKNGGLTYISVSDNGHGIACDDVPRAFLRHATSKIKNEYDLEAISTLGFRGEALAAITSVSRVELITRETSEAEGTRALAEGGHVLSLEPAGRPAGTTITVRDLFFNIPARLKFVKTDRAEAAAISAAVTRLALSRPDIAVRYIRDGNEELRTPGDGRQDSCVYSVLGRDFMGGTLPVASETEGISVSGYVSKVSALRGNRNGQYFFVNGRCVKSKTLQAALEQAYRNRMFTGRFPACVVYIETGAGRLDVNVHPAKTEIKFLFEKHVFDAVHYGALAALEADMEPPATVDSPSAGETPPQRMSVAARQDSDSAPVRSFASKPRGLPTESFMPWGGAPAKPLPQNEVRDSSQRNPTLRTPVLQTYMPSIPALTDEPEQTELEDAPQTSYRVIGEAMNTYIAVEAGGSLWLIDKHAAHERVHFDRLQSENYDPMPQSLVEPVIVSPGSDGTELLLENTSLLERLGFSLDDFGDGRVAVRGIPTSIDIGETENALTEICTELSRGGDMLRHRDEILASVACKAAIKAGRESGERELFELAGRVMRGEVRYCPHGRPVAVEITKSFIDKSFKRI